ncbi:alpha-2-macroglobulin [Aplysia californica]|uniref:Alpha-2-macroglobulin n=1 Tax=Aplysia californica TaxID=6500 RepID=A0ABM0JXZ4_APLCA|nr:alpha-2-macroglobulin [Aplysia californica]
MSTLSAAGLLVIAICSIQSSSAKDGFIFTVPQLLRTGTNSEFCLTIHSDEPQQRAVNTSLISSDDGSTKVRVEVMYSPGVQKCTSFRVPEQGEYELLLSNETDILHDSVEVSVLEDKPITLVQTDKPMYKPGQKVKFRIMTLLKDLTPRIGKINSIFITDPNQIRVKQFVNVDTKGLASLEFQLSSEAKLGIWKIDVTMMDKGENNAVPVPTTFEVKEYVLPRFEVEVNPPPFLLANTEIIEGSVCAKYTYGKMVQGFLDLKICWGYSYGPNIGHCTHKRVELSGCYNFTANMTEFVQDSTFMYYGTTLQLYASVTERGTGVVVGKNHSGPGLTREPLKIEIDDYTNGFFKPRLPYVGKVTVKRPDGSPAAGELIRISAKDYSNSLLYSGNFTSDSAGVIAYSLCGSFTENTTTISVTAEAILYSYSEPWQPGSLNTPRGYREVRQWFSPSLSYIQIPRSDLSLKCGDRFTHGIPFTTRAGRDVKFTYQVMSRGQIVKTGHVNYDTVTGFLGHEMGTPSENMCLEWEEQPTVPPPPTMPYEIPPNVDAAVDETSMGEGGEAEEEEEIDIDEVIAPPTPPEIELIPPTEFQEPIVRPELLSDTVSTVLLDMAITTEMAPRFTLLVYHIMDDGEVVADSMEFQVEPCFANDVKMAFNRSTALPGEKVGVQLKAEPGSVCGVGVVDKSVNILGGNHQVTTETVFKRIEELATPVYRGFPMAFTRDNDYCEKRINSLIDEDSSETVERYWHYSSPYVDALQAFQSGGFIVITNLNLETRPCGREHQIYYYAWSGRSGMTPEGGAIPAAVPLNEISPNGAKSPKAPRTNFPETWLWDLVLVGENGASSTTHTAPDTITSWVGNAMCVEKTKGFGVSPLTSITTFQPFFLSLKLPYAAVRGERLPIILTVYNYLDKCLHIQLTLDAGEGFDVHNIRRQRKPVCLCGGKSHSITFFATPKDIGSLPLMAKAEVIPGLCSNAIDMDTGYEGYTDAVKRVMLVKAEGVTQEYTSTHYMCAKADKPEMQEVILPLPEDMVKDSARGEVRVIGDIMGPALTNLDSLVRMPTGCGEQNMVGFVPNILVLKYLKKSGRLTEEIHDKAIEHMEVGYQRELNYRHGDGSFSAFGVKDERGSVWLTAFVVKSFAQAQEYIYIDDADLALSINFLRRSQLETGCFRETGAVFSSYMMGGLGKGKKKESFASLTAYVLVALLKANVKADDRIIVDGMKCMNREFKTQKGRMDPYTLSLVAYANILHMPYGRMSREVVKILDAKAKQDGSFRYWARDSQKPKSVNTWYYYAAPSAEVEMTSYALLAYLNFYGNNAVAQTHDIAMWISQQRNPHGGFSSTQDTVIGLNALSEFAELAYDATPKDVRVLVDGTDLGSTMSVSERLNNTLLLQTEPIATLPNKLQIKVKGVGCALVQANVRYNKLPFTLGGETKPSFHLKVITRLYSRDIDRCDRRTIVISVGARGSQKFNTGMTIVTVKMVTGWTPVKDSFIYLQEMFPALGMKRYENNEEEGTLSFYFEELSRRPKQFSFDVEQDQALKVSSPKPADVRVYQYYETDVSVTRPYRLKTICGTKEMIPRRRNPAPIPGQAFPVQRRIDLNRGNLGATARESNCPLCPLIKIVPKDLKSLVCNSSAIYKAVSGRNATKPLKLKQDMRPVPKGKSLSVFAKYDVPEGCSCSLLTPPSKRVVIFVQEKITRKVLKMDDSTSIFLASKKLEKEIRKQRKSCPPQE